MTPATPISPSQFPADRGAFVCAYATDVAPGDVRPAEDWARQMWEGAPTLLRWFMWMGWRGVLRLRLGQRHSPDHILGWQVIEREPDLTVCHLRSSSLSAYNTFARREGRLVWSTYVLYDRPLGRLIWLPASLLHRPIVRYSLARAQRRGREV